MDTSRHFALSFPRFLLLATSRICVVLTSKMVSDLGGGGILLTCTLNPKPLTLDPEPKTLQPHDPGTAEHHAGCCGPL